MEGEGDKSGAEGRGVVPHVVRKAFYRMEHFYLERVGWDLLVFW